MLTPPDYLEISIDKFLFRVAADRLYTPEGVWAREEDAGRRVRLGISDYQQQLNGDMAFVHLKPLGTVLRRGDEFADIETIKATTGFASPAAGTIGLINGSLEASPELVNQDPYGQGWLAIVDAVDFVADRAALLSPEAYLAAIRRQAEEELAP